MRWNGTTAAAAIALIASAAAGEMNGLFDKPVDKQVIKLPPDPDNPQAKPALTCFVYARFLVKQIDLGELGADELSVTAIPSGETAPVCARKIAHERVINPDDWSGYFDGAKGDFLLFDAGDGVNGGMPFAVFGAATGKKLFEDSRHPDAFEQVALADGALVMRYRRVYLAPCSLYADPKGCWHTIMTATSLAGPAGPNCRAAYEKEMKRTPKFAKDIANARTVIGYSVEARYAAGKLDFKPRPGAATCWLED